MYRMTEYKRSDRIVDEIIELSIVTIKNPCCCGLCGPRIGMLRRLGGDIKEKHSFLEARWANTGGQVIIVPDNPGCFITRVIDGVGTILSCIGVGDESFNALVYDREYNVVENIVVEYRRTSHISYHYTRKVLEEYKYIIVPSGTLPRIEGYDIIGDMGFKDILAQAIGLYAALNYGYNLLIIYRSIITLGNELREAVVGSPVIIGSRELYNRIQKLLEDVETTYIPIENDKISIGKLQEIVKILEQKRQV